MQCSMFDELQGADESKCRLMMEGRGSSNLKNHQEGDGVAAANQLAENLELDVS